MFRWYQDAQVCYAYLSDVPEGDGDPSAAGSAFRKSKWFTRGWTLQELLAPSRVVFYDHNWIEIGTKSSLYKLITAITGIKPLFKYEHASIAQKMSWASRRETTREEDMAYCLMGLFGVNMPPLYGEGENAFVRLQLEILNKSDDESIFAWREMNVGHPAGLLARSPAAFNESGDILKDTRRPDRPSYAMTNKGLHIELFLMSTNEREHPHFETALTPLNCFWGNVSKNVAIKLVRISEDRWHRVVGELPEWSWNNSIKGLKKFIYVPQDAAIRMPPQQCSFLIRTQPIFANGFQIQQKEVSGRSSGVWTRSIDSRRLTLKTNLAPLNLGALLLGNAKSEDKFVLTLEADSRGDAGVNIVVSTGVRPLTHMLESFFEKQPEDERSIRQDRVSRSLSSGLLVSAVMVKRVVADETLYVVDVTLGK
jgi:hypothetical protein